MRWQSKRKSSFDKIKKRFAIIPVLINDTYVWLESYYEYREDYGIAIGVERFFTLQAAEDFIRSLE